MAEQPSEHSHNPDVTIPGCLGCAAAIAEMSPVERAMRDLRQAANKFRAAWDWHMDCVRMLGRHEVVQQSEASAQAADRELGEAAQRYAEILAMAAPTTAATDLTVDQLANWASGRPTNPTTAHGVHMAMEIQRHRIARFARSERVMDVVRAAFSILSDRSGAQFAQRHIEIIATFVADKLAPPASSTVLDASTRDVITAIINFQSHTGKWVEAAALRTLLSIVDRSPQAAAGASGDSNWTLAEMTAQRNALLEQVMELRRAQRTNTDAPSADEPHPSIADIAHDTRARFGADHDLLDQDLDYLMNNVAGPNGFARPLIIEIRRHRAMVKRLEAWADRLEEGAPGTSGAGQRIADDLRVRLRGGS